MRLFLAQKVDYFVADIGETNHKRGSYEDKEESVKGVQLAISLQSRRIEKATRQV